MRTRVAPIILVLLFAATPVRADTASASGTVDQWFAFQGNWSTPAVYAEVWLYGSIRTEATAAGPVTTRSTSGWAYRCDWLIPECVGTDLGGNRTEAQMAFEPAMNAVAFDFCEGTVCMQARLSQPSALVVNCLSAGCASANPWVDGIRAHLDAQVVQGVSRGSYRKGFGTAAGQSLAQSGAWSAYGWFGGLAAAGVDA